MWRVSTVISEAGLRKQIIPSDKVLAGLRRGTAVHRYFEAHALGEALPMPEHDEYTAGIRQWFIDFRPTVLFTERRIINRRKRVTGQIDLGIHRPGPFHNTYYIVDLKRSAPEAWHAIQLAGYYDIAAEDQLLCSQIGRVYWQRANLYLPGDGRYVWTERTDHQDCYLWRSALALVQWRYDHGLFKRTDPERPDEDAGGSTGAVDAGERAGDPDSDGLRGSR